MKTPYSFCILRYVHDAVTQEFINIGVAVYAPEEGFLRARCDTRYARITRTFAKIEGEPFRQLMRFIESRIHAIGDQQKHPLLAPLATIDQLLAQVLPPDDSAFAGKSQTGGPFFRWQDYLRLKQWQCKWRP